MQWKTTIDQQFDGLLSSSKTLDIWKYGIALRTVSTTIQCHLQAWATKGIFRGSSLKDRVTALVPLTKVELDSMRLPSAHPVFASYSPFRLRVRFLKGFALEAFEILRIEVWERMAKAKPSNTAVLLVVMHGI